MQNILPACTRYQRSAHGQRSWFTTNLRHNFRACASMEGIYFVGSLLHISFSVRDPQTHALSGLGNVSNMMRFAVSRIHNGAGTATGGCSSRCLMSCGSARISTLCCQSTKVSLLKSHLGCVRFSRLLALLSCMCDMAVARVW